MFKTTILIILYIAAVIIAYNFGKDMGRISILRVLNVVLGQEKFGELQEQIENTAVKLMKKEK